MTDGSLDGHPDRLAPIRRLIAAIAALPPVRRLGAILTVYDASGGGLMAAGLAYGALFATLTGLLFAFGVSLVTGIAFGIATAWMATRVDPIEALRGASRSSARKR